MTGTHGVITRRAVRRQRLERDGALRGGVLGAATQSDQLARRRRRDPRPGDRTPAVVVDGGDLDARSDLLYGAYLAGSAFAVAGSGLHHKICHVLGGAYDLPHAETHAIVLPHVLAFNAPAATSAAARIGRALGSADPVAGLHSLSKRVGIPNGLRDIGLRNDQLDEAVALIEPAVPADNPVPVTTVALRSLLEAAWSGEAAEEKP